MYSLYIMYICTSVWMAIPRRHDMACSTSQHMHDRKTSRSVKKSLYGGRYHLSNFEVFSLYGSSNEGQHSSYVIQCCKMNMGFLIWVKNSQL